MIYRCPWSEGDELMRDYHDKEWGVPLRNDQKIFEFMVLDAFQAGLSWKTILHKRKNFEKALANFQPGKIARYGLDDYERLLNDKNIIRNRAKIQATITNAQKFLEVKDEFGSFSKYIWEFVDNKPIVNRIRDLSEFPTKNDLSDKMSSDLKKRGFKFVGSTICYSFMEAAGLLNNHFYKCFRYKELTD